MVIKNPEQRIYICKYYEMMYLCLKPKRMRLHDY